MVERANFNGRASNKRATNFAHDTKVMNLFGNKSIDTSMDLIIKGIYLGSLKVALTRDKMKRAGVTHILQVLDDFNPYFPKDFRYKVVKILDNKNVNILRYFRATNRFI